MQKELTTKDLMALNELMTFENWMSGKMKLFSQTASEQNLKTMFKSMATKHMENHKKLLEFLKANSTEGGK